MTDSINSLPEPEYAAGLRCGLNKFSTLSAARGALGALWRAGQAKGLSYKD
jgi:hypothetical protein